MASLKYLNIPEGICDVLDTLANDMPPASPMSGMSGYSAIRRPALSDVDPQAPPPGLSLVDAEGTASDATTVDAQTSDESDGFPGVVIPRFLISPTHKMSPRSINSDITGCPPAARLLAPSRHGKLPRTSSSAPSTEENLV